MSAGAGQQHQPGRVDLDQLLTDRHVQCPAQRGPDSLHGGSADRLARLGGLFTDGDEHRLDVSRAQPRHRVPAEIRNQVALHVKLVSRRRRATHPAGQVLHPPSKPLLDRHLPWARTGRGRHEQRVSGRHRVAGGAVPAVPDPDRPRPLLRELNAVVPASVCRIRQLGTTVPQTSVARRILTTTPAVDPAGSLCAHNFLPRGSALIDIIFTITLTCPDRKSPHPNEATNRPFRVTPQAQPTPGKLSPRTAARHVQMDESGATRRRSGWRSRGRRKGCSLPVRTAGRG